MRDGQRAVFGERLSLSVSGLLCPDNCRAEIVPTRPSPQDRRAGAGSKRPIAGELCGGTRNHLPAWLRGDGGAPKMCGLPARSSDRYGAG